MDYDYQRGVKIQYSKDGSEKSREPNVDWARVNEITSAMLDGKLFGGALTWNLRPDEVIYNYSELTGELAIITGRPTIPDSNHRHQAALKACKIAEATGKEFDLNFEYPLIIEVLSLEGERSLFTEYNQLGRPANPTRSKWIDQANLHNKLTSRAIDASGLKGHIEFVRNTISINSPMVATFNIIAKGAAAAFPDLDESNFEENREFLSEYLEYLVKVRPETGYLPLGQRKAVRENSIGDSGLAFGAYLQLAGVLQGVTDWRGHLDKLAEQYHHHDGGLSWSGDLMDRGNPVWRGTVLIVNANTGKRQVANRTDTRNFMLSKVKEVAGV